MLLMFVCAVGFGWLGKKLDETRREQVVVAEIKKIGGIVRYHKMDVPFEIIHYVPYFHKVERVDFNHFFASPAKVTDAGMVHLEGLPRLEVLNLRNMNVTDSGVSKIRLSLPKNCKIDH